MIVIDGSRGEGGGQIVRSSLALSALSQQPVTLRHVRAGRRKPGLLRQHLTALRAAATVCDARVEGDHLGSDEVVFHPGPIRAGTHRFDVGSAGSANLVLQTILPILACADDASHITVTGGTHNPKSPCTDYLNTTFAAALRAFGPTLDVQLERHGFYPAGGGRLVATIEPAPLRPAHFDVRAPIQRIQMRAVHAGQTPRWFHRIVKQVSQELELTRDDLQTIQVPSTGPGMACMVVVHTEPFPMVFSAFPSRRSRWETVADELLTEVRTWLASGTPVDEHLADQLLIPMALAGGGRFFTTKPSLHTTSHIDVIRQFLDVRFQVTSEEDGRWRIALE